MNKIKKCFQNQTTTNTSETLDPQPESKGDDSCQSESDRGDISRRQLSKRTSEENVMTI